jgi:hypothetical protein
MYMIGLPIVLVGLYVVTGTFGILGVAWLLLFRIVVEQIMLSRWIRKQSRLVQPSASLGDWKLFIWILGTVVAGFTLTYVPDLYLRTAFFLACVALHGVLVTLILFDDVDRDWTRRHMGRVWSLRNTIAQTHGHMPRAGR